MLELIAELRLNKTLFMFTTLKAGQVRLASPAQPSQLPSFLVYIFCGSWRENGEKNFIGKLIVPLILVHLLCIQRVGRVGNQSRLWDFAKFHNARRRLLPFYYFYFLLKVPTITSDFTFKNLLAQYDKWALKHGKFSKFLLTRVKALQALVRAL